MELYAKIMFFYLALSIVIRAIRLYLADYPVKISRNSDVLDEIIGMFLVMWGLLAIWGK